MAKVITSFSAKGGAGSSVITANLGIYLAQKGKKVLLIDAAPNGGTLHSYMNIPCYAVTNAVPDHFSILPLLGTDYQNLKFFSNLRFTAGGTGVAEYLTRWETEIKKSDFDYLFIDFGSTIDADLLSVIPMVDFNLIFTNPDSVSIEKTNFAMKTIFDHQLQNLADKADLNASIQALTKNKQEFLFTPRNLLLLLSEAVPKQKKHIAEVVNKVKIGMIYNNIRNTNESKIKDFYPLVIRNHYGFDLINIGEIMYSEVFFNSISSMMPVITNEKSGEMLEILASIASRLSTTLSKRDGGKHDQ